MAFSKLFCQKTFKMIPNNLKWFDSRIIPNQCPSLIFNIITESEEITKLFLCSVNIGICLELVGLDFTSIPDRKRQRTITN